MKRAVRLDARCFVASVMSFGKTSERSPQSPHKMCLLLHSIRMRGVRGMRRTYEEPHSGQEDMKNTGKC
ncbi:hypothetical protein IA69_05060 [Massilia sp. JS1662]|nr:hypothetical protein IA69_05060 [Massilia sp. JS1662]